jgi:hypothetical protein
MAIYSISLQSEMRQIVAYKLDLGTSKKDQKTSYDICLALRKHYADNIYKGPIIFPSTKEIIDWINSLETSELRSIITLILLER